MGDVAKMLASASASMGAARDSVLKDVGYPLSPMQGGSNSAAPTNTFNPVQAPDMSQANSAAVPQGVAPDVAASLMDPLGPLSSAANFEPSTPQGVAPDPRQNPDAYDNPYTQADNSTAEQPIEVVGDSFQPKGPGWLGDIIDTLLMIKGKPPAFKMRKNMPEVMEGFQSDPERAISRMSKVHAPTAWEMYEDLSRTTANHALRQQRVTENLKEGGTVLANMLGAVQRAPDPKAAYSTALPSLQRYANYMQYPTDMLPTDYDPEAIDLLREQGISVYQRETVDRMNKEFEEEMGLKERQLQDLSSHREQVREERRRYNDARIENMQEDNERATAIPQPAYRKGANGKKEIGGYVMPDGYRAVIIDPKTGKPLAYRLRKKGDINSRIRSPGEDAIVQKLYPAPLNDDEDEDNDD